MISLRALAMDPNDALAYAYKALLHATLGNLEISRDAALQAVAADPLSPLVRALSVMGFSQVGIEGCDATAALAAHQEALSADPATTKPQRPSCCRRTSTPCLVPSDIGRPCYTRWGRPAGSSAARAPGAAADAVRDAPRDVAGGEIGEVAGEAATREAALTGSPPKQGAVPSMTEVVS